MTTSFLIPPAQVLSAVTQHASLSDSSLKSLNYIYIASQKNKINKDKTTLFFSYETGNWSFKEMAIW